MQQINLFLALPKPPQYILSAEKFLQSIIGFVAALIFIYIVGQSYHLYQIQHLTTLRLQQAEALNKLTETKTTYPIALRNMKLQTDIDELQQEFNAKNSLVKLLTLLNSHPVTEGFANDLINLATTIVPDAWLRKITLEEDGKNLILEGSATNSQVAMAFLANLKQSTSKDKHNFQHFAISNPPDDKDSTVNFTISTLPEGKK